MKLIPEPQRLEILPGIFRLTYRQRITLASNCPDSAYGSACLLAAEIEKATGLSLMIDRRSSMPHPGIRISMDASMEKEHYTLWVTTEEIGICAGEERGLLYGIQTLRQIVRQCGCLIPCLKIRDYPDLRARGMFYDVTRGRIPTMAFLKNLAEKCSFYKLNQLHLYIEHSFLFDSFSEIWRDDTPLTAQDILELDAYCRKLHVELVPSIATLGHLYEVLRSKSYHHLSEIEEGDAEFSFYRRMEHHTLDVTQEESLDLVYRMISEYAALFTSDKFNINGDEVFDLGKGRGKQRAEEIGSHRMYVDWIGKISRYVKSLGKQPMFWGDVILEDPGSMGELPEDIICMNWDYSPLYREDHARKLSETGVAQYLCPGIQGWNQTINRFDIAYRNIHKMASLAYQFGGSGLLVTEWGDFGHLQDPEFAAPGIAYAGAMSWNKKLPDVQSLNQAVSVVEYADPTGKLMDVLTKLSDQVIMNWGRIVEYCEIARGRITHRTMERYLQEVGAQIENRLSGAEEINAAIDGCQTEIAALMTGMGQRHRMLPYFLMSDGQKLLNRFAVWLFKGEEDPKVLAGELETWYRDYKSLWYRSSRESELFRIGEVIFWMADELRKHA